MLRVVYLMCTEGHLTTSGEVPVRGDLCEEAIHRAHLIARLMPDEAEALGLLALLLLTDARRAARLHADGSLASLDEQDRSRWDAARIEEGAAVLDRALRLPRPGPYTVQAAIAALHSRAHTREAAARAELLRRAGDTTGARAAYDQAIALSDNPAEREALERRRR